jgi:ATPase subunit of ABC transporter with duplicated ATPase domains
LDVGHGYNIPASSSAPQQDNDELSVDGNNGLPSIAKKDGYLFDCVDLCVEEGSTMCILGNNGCGKSVLLRILAKLEQPVEGKVHHASGVRIGFFDQLAVDALMMQDVKVDDESSHHHDRTALSYLTEQFPHKSEQELRGELTAFGLSPSQASSIGLRFLSGGERSRLCLASLIMDNPPVLFMDNPTSNLDVESVEALIRGLKQWNGTVVLVSHDANFVRSVNAKCHVLVEQEGKLRRVDGGIDAYLKFFR